MLPCILFTTLQRPKFTLQSTVEGGDRRKLRHNKYKDRDLIDGDTLVAKTIPNYMLFVKFRFLQYLQW